MHRPPLLLVRHGATAWTDPVRLYQGHIDVPLSELGREQARRLGAALRERPPAAIWHSPLTRARTTAEAIAATTGAPCRTDDRLRELSFGSWEGRSHEDVRQADPQEHARHYADVLGGTPPGGEPVESLLERLSSFLEERWLEDAEPIAAVTHEGVIRATAVLLGLLPVEDFYRFLPPPGSAVEIVPGDCWAVRIRGGPESVLEVLTPGP
ncbi:MAG TPA: histidine phosphatase family protein [Candidatus Dormibacteraeota bacterium]|nr:histidine phosphatase family protein [Candidatus Dormibacteraeota bacterium]